MYIFLLLKIIKLLICFAFFCKYQISIWLRINIMRCRCKASILIQIKNQLKSNN